MRTLKGLFERLGVSIGPGQEWKVAVPLMTFAGTLVGVIVAGVELGVSAAVYAPLAIAIAVVIAGIPVSYMSGSGADEEDGE
jgi:hypothetical protein